MRMKLSLLAVSLLAIPCAAFAQGKVTSQTDPEIFLAQGTSLDIEVAGQVYAGAISLPLDDERTQVNLGQGTNPLDFCVAEGTQRQCLILQPGEPIDFTIRHEGRDAVLVLSYLEPQANFPLTYRQAHAGLIDVEIPRAYEMVNVALALTRASRAEQGLVASSPYADKVRTRFAALADHPFIVALDAKLAEDRQSYHLLKMNGAAFDLADDNSITRSPFYRSIGWGGNTLLPLQDQMQDFANRANFVQFYAEHADLYAQQIDFMRNALAAEDMLSWLGSEFPDVAPYDYTRILFSPLVGDNQSVARFDDDGFRELQPHVNFPYPSSADSGFSPDAERIWRGLILFTELNHGFINPTADEFTDEIAAAMPDKSIWASGETAIGYRDGNGIFDEMMNWALVSVRAQDELPSKQAALIAERVARMMVKNRGFIRFVPFQERLLTMAVARRQDVSIAALYPQIVAMLPEVAALPAD